MPIWSLGAGVVSRRSRGEGRGGRWGRGGGHAPGLLAFGAAGWHQGRVPDRDGRTARDPLDHLIRSTVPTTAASAAPRRTGGTRSRAGNAMARTRAGLLEGARRAVAEQGTRRTTMNDIPAPA